MALFALKMLKDQDVAVRRRVRVIFGVNEESGMKDMEHYLESEDLPVIAFTPDAGYPVINGEMGILRLRFQETVFPIVQEQNGRIAMKGGNVANMVPDACIAVQSIHALHPDSIEKIGQSAAQYEAAPVTTEKDEAILSVSVTGKSAHGASPASGVNAIAHMLKFLDEAHLLENRDFLARFLNENLGLDSSGNKFGIGMRDELSSPLTINLGIIDIKKDSGYAIVDIRYPVTAKMEGILSRIQAKAVDYFIAVTVQDHMPPFYLEPEHDIVKLLNGVYEEMTGEKAKSMTIAGGSYARKFSGRCVLFGGAGANGHQPNEHVEISRLMAHAAICAQAMYVIATDPSH